MARRPAQSGDRDARDPRLPPRPERIGGDEAALVPITTAVVVAEHVHEGRAEGVGEEGEPARVEVAATDDAVDRTELAPIALEFQSPLVLVGDGEQPDRTTGTLREGPRVGPLHADAADHVGVSGRSMSSSVIDATGRPDPAVRSAREPVRTAA